jgi:hypothetical protein
METTFNALQPRELFWINAAPLRSSLPLDFTACRRNADGYFDPTETL